MAPGVPPLVQGNRAEVDDVGQGAIGAGAQGAGRHHSLAPPPEIVRRGEGIGGKFDTERHDVSWKSPHYGLPGNR